MGAPLALVDGDDFSAGDGRSHHPHMELSGRVEIGGVLTAPEQQRAVFEPAERRADVFHFARFFISAAAARTAFRMFW